MVIKESKCVRVPIKKLLIGRLNYYIFLNNVADRGSLQLYSLQNDIFSR